jgi:hypothetical protein
MSLDAMSFPWVRYRSSTGRIAAVTAVQSGTLLTIHLKAEQLPIPAEAAQALVGAAVELLVYPEGIVAPPLTAARGAG